MNTVLGFTGFIGHNLARVLDKPFCPPREELYSLHRAGNLGHVFYCLGDDAGGIEANIGYLCFLMNCRFESLTYLSSTRVYLGAQDGDEYSPLTLFPIEPGYRFNAVKLAAEQVCLSHPRGTVARLSTVVGLNDGKYLIPGLIKRALKTGKMDVYLGPNVIRDLITIEDVVELLPKIRLGEDRIYNVASGITTTVAQIVSAIGAATGAKAIWHPGGGMSYPPISITQITQEFGFSPRPVLSAISKLCQQYDDIYVKQLLWS